ncbi:hypothetical protein, partial [uncultured Bilophila sp.]
GLGYFIDLFALRLAHECLLSPAFAGNVSSSDFRDGGGFFLLEAERMSAFPCGAGGTFLYIIDAYIQGSAAAGVPEGCSKPPPARGTLAAFFVPLPSSSLLKYVLFQKMQVEFSGYIHIHSS